MGFPVTEHLKIRKGSTFSKVLRWGAAPIVYKAISAITKAAPCRITSTSHGLVEGWPVAVIDVVGMKEINAKVSPPADSDQHKAKIVDSNTVELNDVSSASFTAYQSGGYLRYFTPVDMTGYTARMMIRSKIKSSTVLVILTTENGGIAIDNTAKTITITISAAATAALTGVSAVYDLEMVSSGGVVYPFVTGGIALSDEVTR